MNFEDKSQQQGIYASYTPINQQQAYPNQFNQPTQSYANPQYNQQYQAVPQGYQQGMQYPNVYQQPKIYQQVVTVPQFQTYEEIKSNQQKICYVFHWICMVLVLISIIINIAFYSSASEGSKICIIISYFLWEIGMIIGLIGLKRQNAAQLTISSALYVVSNFLSILAIVLQNLSIAENKEFDESQTFEVYLTIVSQMVIVYCFFGFTCQLRSQFIQNRVSQQAPIVTHPLQNQQIFQQEPQGPIQNI